MKKNINLDYHSLEQLENALGKDEMITFLDRYQVIITQDKESEQYLKNIFASKKTKKAKKS
jgi:hypothetical protein